MKDWELIWAWGLIYMHESRIQSYFLKSWSNHVKKTMISDVHEP